MSDWRHEAACLGRNAELWFPIGQSNAARDQAATAVAWCARCPVREACLGYALDNHIVEGIWGGLDEAARASYKRRRDRRRREGRAVNA